MIGQGLVLYFRVGNVMYLFFFDQNIIEKGKKWAASLYYLRKQALMKLEPIEFEEFYAVDEGACENFFFRKDGSVVMSHIGDKVSKSGVGRLKPSDFRA